MPADAPLVQAPWAAAFASQDGLILYNGLTGRSLTARGVTQDAWAAFADGPLPRSAVPREAWALVTKILVYPLVVIVTIAGAWIFYKLSLFWVAIAWSLLPIVNILLLFI